MISGLSLTVRQRREGGAGGRVRLWENHAVQAACSSFTSRIRVRFSCTAFDFRACTPNVWRGKLIYLEQRAPLLHRTVRENIAMGRYGDGVEPASRRKSSAPRTAAGAHKFITELPQGYDTLVDENGENLSGGQRQRIAIARAFLADADLLLLDEPTAALDTESQQVVWKSLQKLMKFENRAHHFPQPRKPEKLRPHPGAGERPHPGKRHARRTAGRGGKYAELYQNQFQ